MRFSCKKMKITDPVSLGQGQPPPHDESVISKSSFETFAMRRRVAGILDRLGLRLG
jgi:hypothetical protein